MTLVTMTLAVPTGTVGDPEKPAVGTLEWTPYARRVEDDRVVLPDPFTVTLAATPVTVEVEPGPWRVREMTPAGITRWVVVPDLAPPATIGYEDLPSVNRFTLAPDAVPPEPAWSLALAGVEAGIPAAVADYLAANPPSGSPDATAAVKGILRLAGDLGGTAAAPTVPGLATKAAAAHTHAPGDVTGTAVITTDPRLSDARTPTAHAASHATGGTDALTPAAIGAQPAGSYAAALGADDNYVTDAEKVKLANLSGTNTGDQTLPTWGTIAGKPAVIAAGADAATARAAIGAGTSSLVLGTTAGTAKAGDYAPDLSALAVKANNLSDLTNAATARTNLGLGTAATTAATAYATAAQGAKADTAVPSTLVDAKGDLLVGSAADTVARLAVGTDGQVLTADAASAAGVKWAAAGGGGGGSGWAAGINGTKLLLPSGTPVENSFPGWADRLALGPLVIQRGLSFTSISVEVSVAVAASTLRIGIFQESPVGTLTLVYDLGAMDASTAGTKTATLTGTLAPGVYFVGSCATVGNVGIKQQQEFQPYGGLNGVQVPVDKGFMITPGGYTYGTAYPATLSLSSATLWHGVTVGLNFEGVTLA